ncbi:MAG: tetratricopeptide repeat protein [Gammaproteobacteria bacterium]|nr:tetratricopeptide repeat protein [Gammaproteobacteria bacterium]
MADTLQGAGQAGNAGLQARRWLFGPACMDERALTLHVHDRPVKLERKTLEVLLFLLHHAGEVVTKDELLDGVWPGRILTETVLTKCVGKLREALGEDGRSLIKTVHGYGYRLDAPVRVESAAAVTAPHFDFKAGDHPALRPLWSLVERLGAGGHGEAWLSRHDKTGEERVYKFAFDGTALNALKREITLSRLLHDSLGERAAAFARVLDWNLERPPFFIETEYTAGGSLLQWADAQGGLANVALPARIEIAARIAEALFAAHSVGVLHKDLKPANVLMDTRRDGVPAVKLADFGSGGVLDTARLDALGITRMGLTQAVDAGTTSGTLSYLAPEVIAGQPFTVQADVYAVGVMLYQLVVADLRRPLSPDWERDVEDEILCEDIAAAAAGNPAHRLADATRLAQRLRTLDERRSQRAQERVSKLQAERTRQALERMRARRTWMRTALATLAVGLGLSVALYVDARRARNEALASEATTAAVSEFLNQDLLSSGDPEAGPTKDLTLEALLERAAKTVDRRFRDQPQAAAEGHLSLGKSYAGLGLNEQAETQLQKAVALYQRLYGRAGEPTSTALGLLADTLLDLGRPQDAARLWQEVLVDRQKLLDPLDSRVLDARQKLAWARYWMWSTAEQYARVAGELRGVLADAMRAPVRDHPLVDEIRWRLGSILITLHRYGEAEPLLREVVAFHLRTFGPRHSSTAAARQTLADVSLELGRYDEADTELTAALKDMRAWVGDNLKYTRPLLYDLGKLRLRQGRLPEAVAILKDLQRRQVASFGREDQYYAAITYYLGLAYRQQGDLGHALESFRDALEFAEKVGTRDVLRTSIRTALSDIERECANNSHACIEQSGGR